MTKQPRPANQPLRLLLGFLLALLAVAVVGALALAVGARSFRQSDRIAHNVTVAQVPVGDLPRGEALTTLEQEWVPRLPEKLTLTEDGHTFERSRGELGAALELERALDEAMEVGREGNLLRQVVDRLRLMQSSVDVPVRVTVKQATLRAALKTIADQVNHPPVDARVTVTADDQVQVVAGKSGIVLDLDDSAQAVTKALETLTAEKVALVSKTKQPNITAADLSHLEVVLGSFNTPYDSGKVDRTHNLSLAIGSVNGKVVMPGGTFSANEAIGPRLEERGFRDAPIFVNGEITPSTGGGVCQVATTLYNAALLAGLPVTERHHHSMPVHYADAGRDATVYWGSLDLRFQNDTGAPIVVLASMSGSRVHVRIVGQRSAKKKVRIERSGLSQLPFTTVEKPDPTLEIGKKKVEEKGRLGIRVTVHRVLIAPDGNEEKELLHTDTYQPYKQTVLVGKKPPAVPPGGQLPPGAKPGTTAPGAKPAVGAKPHDDPEPPARKPAKPKPKPVRKPSRSEE